MRHRALTVLELLVVVATLSLLFAALAPALRYSRSTSGQMTSMANLQALSTAHVMYAAQWFDRQVTWLPDDAGIYALGSSNWASPYINNAGCPQQLILGWQANPTPTLWAYFLGCGGFPGGVANSSNYVPLFFSSTLQGIGSFRLPNTQAFSPFVDGRFYSEVFYAPNDEITIEFASPMFDYPGEFDVLPPLGTGGLPQLVNSSYALSPSAMWSPKVLSPDPLSGAWYTAPSTLVDAYKSPTVSQCAHPDLKTRMIEHNWNLGAPAPTNPAFAGGFTPYFFNHGLDAAPLTLFFDGHVDVLSTAQAVADDAKVFAETRGEVGLWTRDTPYGELGYFGAQSYDGTVAAHHILTAGGILGRDVLDVHAPLADAPADRAVGRPVSRIRFDLIGPQSTVIK